MAQRRLIREMQEAQKAYHSSAGGNDDQVCLICSEDNPFEWTAKVAGPPDSPFEGGQFALRILCPKEYPIAPPTVTFVTPVFHPNVNFATGEICMDVLKSNWSPAWTLLMLCRAVSAILSDPNADSPLNCEAGNLVRLGDTRGYNSLAKMYTIEYAIQQHSTTPEPRPQTG